MQKKEYSVPILVSREIDLGVFGDYGDNPPGPGGGCGRGGRGRHWRGPRWGGGFWREALPIPVADVRQLNLRME